MRHVPNMESVQNIQRFHNAFFIPSTADNINYA